MRAVLAIHVSARHARLDSANRSFVRPKIPCQEYRKKKKVIGWSGVLPDHPITFVLLLLGG
jgi:hypothetical protein